MRLLINAGNVADVKLALKNVEGTYSIEDYFNEAIAEKKGRNRTSILQAIQTILDRKTRLRALMESYPKKDGDQFDFVRYPSQMEDGKWYAVNVELPTGYSKIVTSRPFETFEACYRACSRHNKVCGFSESYSKKIVRTSMDNSEVYPVSHAISLPPALEVGDVQKEVLNDPKFQYWLHEFTVLGYESDIMVSRVQGQLLELYFRQGRTPADALHRFKKVLRRLDAINSDFELQKTKK